MQERKQNKKTLYNACHKTSVGLVLWHAPWIEVEMNHMNSLALQRRILLTVFLILPIALMLVFVVYPAFRLVLISFTDWDGVSKGFHYIGFQNYKDLIFNTPDTWHSLKNNWLYFIFHALLIPFELIIAVVLNGKIKGSRFFKSVVFLPYMINGVAVAYIFSFFFSSEGGALNMMLEALNLADLKLRWFGSPAVVNYTLVFISLWRFSGSHVILFIAGLQSLPEEVYEAATVDGANAYQKFWYITVPGLQRVIEIVLFLNIRGALQAFDIPFVVTNGGPGNASSTFALYTINTAFKFSNFGMATTMAVALIIMIVAFNKIQNGLFRKFGD